MSGQEVVPGSRGQVNLELLPVPNHEQQEVLLMERHQTLRLSSGSGAGTCGRSYWRVGRGRATAKGTSDKTNCKANRKWVELA